MAYRVHRKSRAGEPISSIRTLVDQLAHQAKSQVMAQWKGKDYDAPYRGHEVNHKRIKLQDAPRPIQRAVEQLLEAKRTIKAAGWQTPKTGECGANPNELVSIEPDPLIESDMALSQRRMRAIEGVRVKLHTDITGLKEEKLRQVIAAGEKAFARAAASS